MKKLLKYGALAGTAMALMPLAARAADDMGSTDYTVTTTTTAADAATAGGLLAGGIIFLIIWGIAVLIGLALLIFWIFMLIDCIKRTNWKQESDKNLWLIILIVGLVIGLGPIAAIVYYFAVKRQLDTKKK